MKKTRKSSCIQFSIVGLFALLLAFSSTLSVQADPLLKIAGNVVRDTVFDLPESGKKPQDSRYNLWMYQNFLLLEGMDALGEVTGNETYKTYSDRNIDFFAAFQSQFGDTMTAGPAGEKQWYTKPSQMWHCGMVAALAERQQERPDTEFLRGMENLDTLLENSPAFEDGVLVRNKSRGRGLGLQIDDLYMIVPYWARKAQLLGEPQWLERAIEESLRYFDYLWDAEDRMMHCLWLQNEQGPYGLYWGRGNGWYIMATTDLLTFVPQNHPKREALLADYRTFIDGILLRQTENGLWRQILNMPESYQETSCSGMFTYCILKGVLEGWLDDPRYFEAGKNGWYGLLSTVDENYELKGVSPGSDIYANPKDYNEGKSPVTHDQHGIGPFLLSGAAYLQASKAAVE